MGRASGIWRGITEGKLSAPDVSDQTFKVYFVGEVIEPDILFVVQCFKISTVKIKGLCVN